MNERPAPYARQCTSVNTGEQPRGPFWVHGMEEVRGSIPLSSTNNTRSQTIYDGPFDGCFWWGTSGGTYTIRELLSSEPSRFALCLVSELRPMRERLTSSTFWK